MVTPNTILAVFETAIQMNLASPETFYAIIGARELFPAFDNTLLSEAQAEMIEAGGTERVLAEALVDELNEVFEGGQTDEDHMDSLNSIAVFTLMILIDWYDEIVQMDENEQHDRIVSRCIFY